MKKFSLDSDSKMEPGFKVPESYFDHLSSEILTKIEMVGNNLGHGQGMCGSSSGSICANVGQPTILVKDIVIGGRS